MLWIITLDFTFVHVTFIVSHTVLGSSDHSVAWPASFPRSWVSLGKTKEASVLCAFRKVYICRAVEAQKSCGELINAAASGLGGFQDVTVQRPQGRGEAVKDKKNED